ncbi:MAG: hypothetical protein ACK443_09500 [Methylococcaceae bacterium]|jgi:hypothetical protein
MRFFVTGEQNRQWLLNTVVLLFLVYMMVLWLSLGLMYFNRMDLTPQSVIDYYLGAEARFTQPRSYQSLLEVSHAHMFSMGMLAVTLTHLLLFANLSALLKISLSVLVYFSAIADEAAGWLVRFVHPAFAWFKIGAFITLELSLAVLIVLVTLSLLRQRAGMQPKSRNPGIPNTPPGRDKRRSRRGLLTKV